MQAIFLCPRAKFFVGCVKTLKKKSCVGDYPAKKLKVLTCRLRQQPCELSALLHEMLCKDLLNNNPSVLLARAY